MALENTSLRKLLKILFLDPRSRQSEIRKDIRADINRENGRSGSGSDFYGPFWADAKQHALGFIDLSTQTGQRIDASAQRRNLYPLLRDGFLLWWNERRRWTNAPFRIGTRATAQFSFPSLAATVKIDSIMSVRDALDAEHVVYPYFSLDPPLSEQAARLGLWLLIQALPALPPEEIRILDVIRGQTFSIDRNPLLGDEEELFRNLYIRLLEDRDRLREDYE